MSEEGKPERRLSRHREKESTSTWVYVVIALFISLWAFFFASGSRPLWGSFMA